MDVTDEGAHPETAEYSQGRVEDKKNHTVIVLLSLSHSLTLSLSPSLCDIVLVWVFVIVYVRLNM